MRRVVFALACAALSCSSDKPPAPVIPLDVVLGAGQARAGRVTKASELIGGPVAYGRVGDVWKLYNARVRFLVQDVGAAVGLDLYGGNVIDADLVRPGDDGANGNDLFRETFPIIGLHAFKAEQIDVVSDGTKGGSAILRVTGTDAPTDIIPQLDGIAQDLGGAITVEYELAPDVPYLKITTTYQASRGQSLDTLGLGDFVSFGASLASFSPENGFTGNLNRMSFLSSSAEGTSYAYVYPDGDVTVPFIDANGTATLLVSKPLPPDGSASVTRYLVVGAGDAASANAPAYALRGIATAPLAGRVTDGSGAAVAGARVTLFKAPYDANAPCVDQAHSAADGSYRLDVPPGDYAVVVGGVGRARTAPVAVSLPSGGATKDFTANAPGAVVLDVGEIVDGARVGAPAKVSFASKDAEAPDPRFGPDPTESERYGLGGVAMLSDGAGTLLLKPGTWRATISRGTEYELTILDGIQVAAGATTTVRADLRRVVDTTGWLAGDYHQHSQGSIDSPVPVRQRVVEDMAEGIEFPAATDHDNVTDFRPHIAALGGERWIGAVIGNEISVNGVGHFNGYPFTVDAADPYAKVGAKFWARKTIREVTEKVHGEPAPVALHVSHPRTKSLAGWFQTVKFDPTTGKAAQDFPIDGFEAVEVNEDLGSPSEYLASNDAVVHAGAQKNPPSDQHTLRDWFALLNLGKPTCALGNSDTHQRNGGTGYPRSYVFFGTDDPRQATGDALVAAIKAQKVTVSDGPFVTVTMNGQAKMGHGEPVSLGGSPTANLGIRVQAPSWIDASTFEVYENGRPLPLARTGANAFTVDGAGALATAIDPADAKGQVVRLDANVVVKPARDSWYVVVVRGKGDLSPVSGASPLAYTNPIYVDVAGDGWTPPGLP